LGESPDAAVKPKAYRIISEPGEGTDAVADPGSYLMAMELGKGIDVTVDAGHYLIRATLPSGDVLSRQLQVKEGESAPVELKPARTSPREELAWAYYLQRPPGRAEPALRPRAGERFGVRVCPYAADGAAVIPPQPRRR
jgi:hypothetical protein